MTSKGGDQRTDDMCRMTDCRRNTDRCAIIRTRPTNVKVQSTRVLSFHDVAIIKPDFPHQTNHPYRDDRICLSHGAFQLISYHRYIDYITLAVRGRFEQFIPIPKHKI